MLRFRQAEGSVKALNDLNGPHNLTYLQSNTYSFKLILLVVQKIELLDYKDKEPNFPRNLA